MEEVGSATPHPPAPAILQDSWGHREAENHPGGLPQPGQGEATLMLVWATAGNLQSGPFFPLASPAVPGASLRPRSPCHRRPGQGCMNCWGGKDGARKGKSVFSQGIRESTQMERTPARCSHLGDESLFMARTEGLGVRGVISLRLPYGQRCLCP